MSQSYSPPRLQHSAGLQPQRPWFPPETLESLCLRLSGPMSNRSDIGIAVIGGTTVTGDGATIIAARGGTATVDMGTMDLCRGSTAGVAGIDTVTTIITNFSGVGASRYRGLRQLALGAKKIGQRHAS